MTTTARLTGEVCFEQVSAFGQDLEGLLGSVPGGRLSLEAAGPGFVAWSEGYNTDGSLSTLKPNTTGLWLGVGLRAARLQRPGAICDLRFRTRFQDTDVAQQSLLVVSQEPEGLAVIHGGSKFSHNSHDHERLEPVAGGSDFLAQVESPVMLSLALDSLRATLKYGLALHKVNNGGRTVLL